MLRAYLLLLLLLMILPLTHALADNTAEARSFVDGTSKQVLDVLNSSAGEDQKQKQLRQLFTQHVDINWMGQFVLGRAWQQADASQRQRYIQSYRDYLLAHYTSNFSDYSGSKYKITDVRDEGNGDFSVRMEINTPDQKEDVLAGYRLHKDSSGQFKIADIIVEGVSLITTQRSEFNSVVQRGGMDGLIASLEQKKQEEGRKS